QVDLGDLAEQLVGVHVGEAVVFVDPGDEFGEGDAQRVIERAVGAYGHDVVVVFKTRPVDFLSFDYAHLDARAQRDLDRRAGDLAVAHGGVAIAHEEHRARHVHREIHGVAGAGFGRIHVAAEGFGDHRGAGFATGRGDTDASEKRMQWNL